MKAVRALGWIVMLAAGAGDLLLMFASSVSVWNNHGAGWVIAGWLAFPIGVFALPIAAGLWIAMVAVYAMTILGAAMSQAGSI